MITGKLGEVMQESAQAAMSYVRSRAESLGLERDFYQKVDIHVHFPEGAIPKDGPSAGITMATALVVGAAARCRCARDVAMTGEITLRGRVLPIGGLKEKVLAAHRAGIKRVLIPEENEKDLKDIPATILKSIRLVLVDHMDEVLRKALGACRSGQLPAKADRRRCGRSASVPAGGDGDARDHHALAECGSLSAMMLVRLALVQRFELTLGISAGMARPTFQPTKENS